MRIGFDAKRAFTNNSGLGNYSRTLIKSLSDYFPKNQYLLFGKKNKNRFLRKVIANTHNLKIFSPKTFIGKRFPAWWRSYGATYVLKRLKVDVFHGLSNELPFNIQKFKGRKIVTIHDLIFIRSPKLYNRIDRTIYTIKTKHACKAADVIIATSEQTKKDLEHYLKVPSEKIKIVYQSCNEEFYKKENNANANKYNLPKRYILNVGTIEERKNLLTLVKALKQIDNSISLVVVGKKREYYNKVAKYIAENNLQKRVLFLDEVKNEELPSIYKSAEIFVYPSFFEGFGIPLIEAATCGVPTITTNYGCFPEVAGNGAVYINPENGDEIATQLNSILNDASLKKSLSENALKNAERFYPEKIANEIMKIYKGDF